MSVHKDYERVDIRVPYFKLLRCLRFQIFKLAFHFELVHKAISKRLHTYPKQTKVKKLKMCVYLFNTSIVYPLFHLFSLSTFDLVGI